MSGRSGGRRLVEEEARGEGWVCGRHRKRHGGGFAATLDDEGDEANEEKQREAGEQGGQGESRGEPRGEQRREQRAAAPGEVEAHQGCSAIGPIALAGDDVDSGDDASYSKAAQQQCGTCPGEAGRGGKDEESDSRRGQTMHEIPDQLRGYG